ncbi:MAG TPA: two-component system sensor histidine kinase NtrB [Candidatus Brocadiia bacterium]|nr:ATP-binding protein [Candidatus Brocadiales bacterium]
MPDSLTEIEVPFGILVADENGVVNAFSEGMKGLGINNIILGRHWYELFPVSIFPKDDSTYPERHIVTKDDKTFELTVYKYFGKDTNGFLIAVRRAEDTGKFYSFVQLNKILCLNEIIAGIAHEIRNPLTYVSGYLQMLSAELPETDPKKLTFRMLTEESERISKIVNELLDFAAQRASEKREVDLKKVLEDVLLLVGYQMRVENIEIVKNFEPAELVGAGLKPAPTSIPASIRVFADPYKLKQLFLNLIQNARDAMPNGGKLSVSMRHSEGNNVEVEIRDTGCGIPPENLNKVFEPFYTSNGQVRRTGLGLFVCKKIIEEHEGRLSLKSTVGEGTVITVTLPLLAPLLDR